MIVTIDGPAGAGKSTVARALAQRLGFEYLDTGSMYRAVALAAMRRGLDWGRPEMIAQLSGQLKIVVQQGRTFLDSEDVTDEVRTQAVTAVTRYAADNPAVREHLVELQRAQGVGRNIVTEGRDQGTVVFPLAGCKIYLTASPEERARRRVEDLQRRGEAADFQTVLADQVRRDQRDAAREVGPLKPAEDAIHVVTDGLSIEQVVEKLAGLVLKAEC